MGVRARVKSGGPPVAARHIAAAAPVVVAEMSSAGAPLPAPVIVLKPEAPEIIGRGREVGLKAETEPAAARKAAEEIGVLGAGAVVQGVPGALHHLRLHQPLLRRVGPIASVAGPSSYPSICAVGPGLGIGTCVPSSY